MRKDTTEAATPEQRLMIANRRRDEVEWAERQREYAAKREEAARQDKFQRVREDAERRRAHGDHEGAAFLEQWIERQTAKEGRARRTKDDARHAQESIPGEAVS
jgi:hypothetical protein